MTRRLWVVRYRCGCSDGPAPRRELFEYCGKHGDNAVEWIRLFTKRELEAYEEIYGKEKQP